MSLAKGTQGPFLKVGQIRDRRAEQEGMQRLEEVEGFHRFFFYTDF